MQYEVQTRKNTPHVALLLLKYWRNKPAGEGAEELKLIRQCFQSVDIDGD